jgi:branched-chain amino acid transport system ATP-binding protein
MSSAAPSPLLELRDVSVSYGRSEALRSVNLRVARGEFVTVLGPNGAGKSTMMRAILRLVPSTGTFTFEGEDVSRRDTRALARQGIILVPEGRGLFPHMTVAENLVLGAYLAGGDRAEIERRRTRVFDLFPRLKERTEQRASSMSGGEQQMLALGRALMAGPRLLILDEPSLGLAPRAAEEILATLGDLNRQGLTILLVEQKAPLALKLAQRAYVLSLGRIAAELSPDQITSHHDLAQYYLS